MTVVGDAALEGVVSPLLPPFDFWGLLVSFIASTARIDAFIAAYIYSLLVLYLFQLDI